MNPGHPLAQNGHGSVSRALVQTVLDAVRDTPLPQADALAQRLAEEGESFQELLQEQRRQLACHYLRNERLGLLDIALLLGYAEHSAFSTAFRQWYGVTPGQFRGGR